jgi:hypothetical protein
MNTDTIPAPSAATIRRELDSDQNGVCRVCGAQLDWTCDAVVHQRADKIRIELLTMTRSEDVT